MPSEYAAQRIVRPVLFCKSYVRKTRPNVRITSIATSIRFSARKKEASALTRSTPLKRLGKKNTNNKGAGGLGDYTPDYQYERP